MSKGKRFYFWLLPAYFSIGCPVSLFFPGGEYAFWYLGSLPGTWICDVLPNLGSLIAYLPPAWLAGVATTALIGRWMDYVCVPKRFWLITVAAVLAATGMYFISKYPSVERAIAQHGSMTAYVLFALNVAAWLGSAFCLIATVVWKKGVPRKINDPKHPQRPLTE